MVNGADAVPAYTSTIILALDLSNVVSYSKKISGSFYAAAVSPLHKIPFPEKLVQTLQSNLL